MKNKYNQALDFFKNRKLNKAKNICEEILKEHPDSFDTLHLLGLILFLNQNYHQSANLINKAIKIKSDSAGNTGFSPAPSDVDQSILHAIGPRGSRYHT